MNYETMSDNELNMMVADLRGGYAGNVHDSESMVKVSDPNSGGLFYMEVDYCNNPSDAWPIIVENSITFNYDTAQVHVSSYFNESIKKSTNRKYALRAAMIVFLMMQESKS